MADNCVFCDRSKLEERIIAENSDWYVVASLGQITDGGYVILIPKNHIACMAELGHEQVRTMSWLVGKIYRVLSEIYCRHKRLPYPVTMFEHGIVGQTVKHMHVHFLPEALNFTPKVRQDFPHASIVQFEHPEILLHDYNLFRQPYLWWTDPSGNSFVCWNPPAPPVYLRHVAAVLLGRPERGDWRNVDPKLDEQLWKETVMRLEPYLTLI